MQNSLLFLEIAAASFALPVGIAAATWTIARPETLGSYSLLIIISFCAFFILFGYTSLLYPHMSSVTADIHDPIIRTLARTLLINLMGDVFLFLPYFLWVATLARCGPREALYAAIMAAMVFSGLLSFSFYVHGANSGHDWSALFWERSAFALLADAGSAAVIGTWTALVIAEGGRRVKRRLAGAFAISVLADALWGAGIDLGHSGGGFEFSASVLLLVLASIALNATAIAVGVIALCRAGIRLGRRRHRFG